MLYKSILALVLFQATHSRPFLGTEVSLPRALDDILPTAFPSFDEDALTKLEGEEAVTMSRLDDDLTRLLETLETGKLDGHVGGATSTHKTEHASTMTVTPNSHTATATAHPTRTMKESSTSSIPPTEGATNQAPEETSRRDERNGQTDEQNTSALVQPSHEINRWKVVGIAVLTVTFVVVVVLGAVFFDTWCKFLKDVFCGRKSGGDQEDMIPDWENKPWDKHANSVIIRDLSEQIKESQRRSSELRKVKYGPEDDPHPLEPLVRRPSNRLRIVPPIVVHHV